MSETPNFVSLTTSIKNLCDSFHSIGAMMGEKAHHHIKTVYYGYLLGKEGFEIEVYNQSHNLIDFCTMYAKSKRHNSQIEFKKAFFNSFGFFDTKSTSRAINQSIQETMLCIAELNVINPLQLELSPLYPTGNHLGLWFGVYKQQKKEILTLTQLISNGRIRFRGAKSGYVSVRKTISATNEDEAPLSARLDRINGLIAGKEAEEFNKNDREAMKELLLSIACTLEIPLPRIPQNRGTKQ